MKKVMFTVLCTLIFVSKNTNAQINFLGYTQYGIPNTEIDHVIAGQFLGNDNRNDIIVPTNYDGGVNDFQNRLYQQNNMGNLQIPMINNYNHSNYYGITSVTSGQMDENSSLDYGYAEGDSVHIQYQNTTGGLDAPIGYYAGTSVNVVKFGDINNDHHDDIIVSLLGQPYFAILAGDGHGIFSMPMHYSTTSVFNDDIEIGKINTSENVVAKITDSSVVSVFEIDSAWNLINTTQLLLPVGSNITSIAIGDNKLVADYSTNSIHYMSIWNDLTGTSPDSTFVLPGLPGAIQIEHLNCDTRSQIVELSSCSNMVNIVSQNTITTYYVPCSNFVKQDAICVSDVNGDGYKDIITCDYFTGMYVLLNTSMCSATVGTSEFSRSQKNFEIYPNPCQNQLHIKNVQTSDQITICDITGRIIAKIEAINNDIDTGFLNPGLYIVTSALSKQSIKFIKE